MAAKIKGVVQEPKDSRQLLSILPLTMLQRTLYLHPKPLLIFGCFRKMQFKGGPPAWRA